MLRRQAERLRLPVRLRSTRTLSISRPAKPPTESRWGSARVRTRRPSSGRITCFRRSATAAWGSSISPSGGVDREAVTILERSASMRRAPSAPDTVFLAMAHQRLGEAAVARAALARVRVAMRSPANAESDELQAFLREAEALTGGAVAKPAAKQD